MKCLRWVPIFIWVLIICWLSFSPLDKLIIKPPLGADKLAHIGMYALLGSSAIWTTSSKKWRYMLFIFAFVFAGATEVIQHLFVLNRTGDLYDFIANSIGLVIILFILKRFRKT
ncbi:VanZ family protein [Vicingaceae bacterium]|nr:VanZ family protein [Vicingaceae bacterium]